MNIFEENYKVRYSECDRDGRMKLKTFMDYAQETAGSHAAALGVGFSILRPRHMAWLLSRIRLGIRRYPRVGETIRVRTYPQGFDRLFARREFRFCAENGEVCAEATSLWILFDMLNRKIMSVQHEAGSLMPDNSALPVAFPLLGKLPPPDAPETLMQCTIRETQIDLNGHLNNAEYAGLVQDTLGHAVYPAEFQINYQKAIPPASRLTIAGTVDGSGFNLIGQVEGTTSFECAGTLMAQPD